MITLIVTLSINYLLVVRGASINSTEELVQIVQQELVEQTRISNSTKESSCHSEPTCHSIEQMPLNARILPITNCMCDADCLKYGDCCSDSPYYNETAQIVNSKQFYCLPSISVYSVVTCPPTYSNAEVKSKCYLSKDSSVKNDTKLMIPVTNTQRRITFGNEYCALCNAVTEFEAWNISLVCWSTNASTNAQINNFLILKVQDAKFDSVSKTYISIRNGTHFTCNQTTALSHPDVKLRGCLSAISTCPSGKENKLCESQAAFGYAVSNSSIKTYRNKHCAQCNGETGDFKFCIDWDIFYQRKLGLEVLFKPNEANTNGCGDLQGHIRDVFCQTS